MVQDMFDEEFDEAQVYGVRQYLTPGDYLLKVRDCKHDEDRKGNEFFAAGLQILWSEGEEALPAGEDASYYQKREWDGALGRIKGFIAAVWGHDPREVTQEVARGACSEENPLGGSLVYAKARPATSKKKETPVTNIQFIPYVDDEGQEAAEARDPRRTGQNPFRVGTAAAKKKTPSKEESSGEPRTQATERKKPVTAAAALLKGAAKDVVGEDAPF